MSDKTKKPMTLAQALRAWNGDPKHDEARTVMLARIAHRAVIERGADGKILVDETVDRLGFALEHAGNDQQAGCVSPAVLFAEAKPQTEADPIDRRPLRKGKTLTRPVVDWSPVGMARREVAGYATETGQVPTGGSELAAFHLGQPQLQPPWSRLASEWTTLEGKLRKTQAERDLVQRVKDRLFVQSDAGSAAAPESHASVHIAGASYGNVIMTGNGNSVSVSAHGVASPSAPLIYVLADRADVQVYDELKVHMTFALRKGRVALDCTLHVPFGDVTEDAVMAQMRRARVIVLLVSPEGLSSQWDHYQRAIALGVRIVPVRVRPCLADDVKGESLPRDGSAWITMARDRAAVMSHVASELLNLIDILG